MQMENNPLYQKAYVLDNFVNIARELCHPIYGGIVEDAHSYAMAIYIIPRLGMGPILNAALEGPESAGESLAKRMCNGNNEIWDEIKTAYAYFGSWRKVIVNSFNAVYIDYCSMWYSPFFIPQDRIMMTLYHGGLIPSVGHIKGNLISDSATRMVYDGYARVHERCGHPTMYVSYSYFTENDVSGSIVSEIQKVFPSDYTLRWFDVNAIYNKGERGYFPSMKFLD